MVLALVLLVPTLSGCSALPARGCVPRILVEPLHATPGQTITVTSDTTCDVSIPAGGWVVVAAHVGTASEVLATVTSEDTFDGSFSVQLTLSADFPTGEALAGVKNWDYSFCTDSNSSCAVADGSFYVDP